MKWIRGDRFVNGYERIFVRVLKVYLEIHRDVSRSDNIPAGRVVLCCSSPRYHGFELALARVKEATRQCGNDRKVWKSS